MAYLTVFTFRDQMQRLERYLGRKMRDDQREEYFNRLVGVCVDELFSRAIDRIIDEGKTHFLPLVSEILDAYETERAGISYVETKREPCDDCNGTGFIMWEADDGHTKIAPCRCAKGQRILAGWKKRGFDKIIERENRRFGGRSTSTQGDDSFDPEEFSGSKPIADVVAGVIKQLPLVEEKNPFLD